MSRTLLGAAEIVPYPENYFLYCSRNTFVSGVNVYFLHQQICSTSVGEGNNAKMVIPSNRHIPAQVECFFFWKDDLLKHKGGKFQCARNKESKGDRKTVILKQNKSKKSNNGGRDHHWIFKVKTSKPATVSRRGTVFRRRRWLSTFSWSQKVRN